MPEKEDEPLFDHFSSSGFGGLWAYDNPPPPWRKGDPEEEKDAIAAFALAPLREGFLNAVRHVACHYHFNLIVEADGFGRSEARKELANLRKQVEELRQTLNRFEEANGLAWKRMSEVTINLYEKNDRRLRDLLPPNSKLDEYN